MKYRNKLTNEVIEPKTFSEKYICLNNSNYELIPETKEVETVVETETNEEESTIQSKKKKNKK